MDANDMLQPSSSETTMTINTSVSVSSDNSNGSDSDNDNEEETGSMMIDDRTSNQRNDDAWNAKEIDEELNASGGDRMRIGIEGIGAPSLVSVESVGLKRKNMAPGDDPKHQRDSDDALNNKEARVQAGNEDLTEEVSFANNLRKIFVPALLLTLLYYRETI
jgi:hypothetical protein